MTSSWKSLFLLFLNYRKNKCLIIYRHSIVILTKLVFRQYLWKHQLMDTYIVPLSSQSLCTLYTLMSAEIILPNLQSLNCHYYLHPNEIFQPTFSIFFSTSVTDPESLFKISLINLVFIQSAHKLTSQSAKSEVYILAFITTTNKQRRNIEENKMKDIKRRALWGGEWVK